MTVVYAALFVVCTLLGFFVRRASVFKSDLKIFESASSFWHRAYVRAQGDREVLQGTLNGQKEQTAYWKAAYFRAANTFKATLRDLKHRSREAAQAFALVADIAGVDLVEEQRLAHKIYDQNWSPHNED